MQKDTRESAWLHCTLFVLLLSGATIGCGGREDPDASVVNWDQRGAQGGVEFREDDPSTEARVNLREKMWGQTIKWYVPKGQPYVTMPDPNKSNEIVILRPPNDVGETEVIMEGDFQKDGNTYHVRKSVHISNSPRPK